MSQAKVSKPFSYQELCTIITEHDEDRGKFLLTFFQKLTQYNVPFDFGLNTILVEDRIIKMPLSYINLRQAKYDEARVIDFAKGLLDQLPAFVEVGTGDDKKLQLVKNEKTKSKDFIKMVKYLDDEIFTKHVETLEGRIACYLAYKENLDYSDAELVELASLLLKGETGFFKSSDYVRDYMITLNAFKRKGFDFMTPWPEVIRSFCPEKSIMYCVANMFDAAVEAEDSISYVTELRKCLDINSSVDGFKAFGFHPRNWLMKACMTAVASPNYMAAFAVNYTPTSGDEVLAPYYRVIGYDSGHFLSSVLKNAEYPIYPVYVEARKLSRLAATMAYRLNSEKMIAVFHELEILTKKMAYISADQLTMKIDKYNHTKPTFWHSVWTSPKGGLDLRTVVGLGNKAYVYATADIGLHNYLSIVQRFYAYDGFFEGFPAWPDLLEKDELHSAMNRMNLLNQVGNEYSPFYALHVFHQDVYSDIQGVMKTEVLNYKDLAKIYNEANKGKKDVPGPELIFNTVWGVESNDKPEIPKSDSLDIVHGTVKTIGVDLATEGGLSVLGSVAGLGNTKMVFDTVKNLTVHIQKPDVAFIKDAESVKAVQLPVCTGVPITAVFEGNISPDESDIDDRLFAFLPHKSVSGYYRILQVHQTDEGPVYIAFRWTGKVLSVRTKGKITSGSLKYELSRMLFKDNATYHSVHLEIQDRNTVLAVVNTMLNRFTNQQSKIETVYVTNE